jgi:hypothetical protein
MLVESGNKLNSVQMHLLKMFSKPIDDDSLIDIKKILSDYFFSKTVEIADSEWDKRAYNNNTVDKWIFEENQ